VIDPDILRRWPDVEAPELLAHDATDRLLLDEAAPASSTSPTSS
jgi:16S rRNA (guanine1207-N2)-methyltransferase